MKAMLLQTGLTKQAIRINHEFKNDVGNTTHISKTGKYYLTGMWTIYIIVKWAVIAFCNKWDHGWNDWDHHLRCSDCSEVSTPSTENILFGFKWEAETLHHPWSAACLSQSHVVLQPGTAWYSLKACWYFVSNMLLHEDPNVATSITKKTHLYLCQRHMSTDRFALDGLVHTNSPTQNSYICTCVLADIVWLVFDCTQTQWLHHGMQPLQMLYRDSMVPKAKWIIH